MRTILVAEDEPQIAGLVRDYLEHAGFAVLAAADGAAAIATFRARRPDALVLDLGLPRVDGLDVVRAIRRESAVPIVILTARGDETDRVTGLELGADDYVVKPFSAGELIARIRAILRRGRAHGARTAIEVGRIRLEPDARAVTRSGEPVTLAAREFDLLACLMRNAGRVLRREEIMDEVWDSHWFGSTKTLDVHIAWLRKKLEDDPSHPRYITTIRGVGFSFAAPDDGAIAIEPG